MTAELNLSQLGWGPFFDEQYTGISSPDTVPARVISQERDVWVIASEAGELAASITGRFRTESGLFPAVGDWVAVQPLPGEARGIIRSVLPRKSAVTRQAPGGRQRLSGGRTEEQVLAANIDIIFIVAGLDGGRNMSLRRLERYVALAWNSGAAPLILLNKADLCDDPARLTAEVEAIAPGVPVHTVSALKDRGLEPVRDSLSSGVTGVFIGQSGAGKSALINALLGYERQLTGPLRPSDREGRHTTTRRELILLPAGGIVIDTPGIRELQLWGGESGLENAFPDIDDLAAQCRFQDCAHEAEPGCAVKAALERGELDYDRLENYRKLREELRRQAARTDEKIRSEDKAREKQFGRMLKDFQKYNRY